MSRKTAAVLVPIVMVVLVAGLIAYAAAQPQQGFQGRGGGQRDPGMMGMMMRGMGGAAIAVSDGAVYVVSMGMLLKYDAETLELLAQAELPRPQMPAMPGGPGGPGQ